MPATLPQLLRRHYLQAPPPLGSPLANPHHTLQPRAQTAPACNTQYHPCTAGVPKNVLTAQLATDARRRTTEVQRRQLRHPSETRCQRRCPIISNEIVCKHRRPSARCSQTPTTHCSPARKPPRPATRNIIHAQPAFAHTRSQRSWPPMHAGVPLRSSDVSCVILPRLGASDAAPSSPMKLSASTAARRLAARKPPPHATAPRATLPGLQHAISSMHSRRSHTRAHSAAGRRCTQAYD